MVSKYFELTVNSEKFHNETNALLKSLEGQKVLLYGAGLSFLELKKMFDFNKLNIIAIADKKFEQSKKIITNYKQIVPSDVLNEDFDKILITNEQPRGVKKYLLNTLNISEDKILQIFNEEIREEALSVNHLYENKFDKTLPKLVKKLKNKTVVIYGAGVYFEAILKYFDLSGLNIIGISDKRFEGIESEEYFKGYKIYAPTALIDLKPDYILVATKYYISIVVNLHDNMYKGTGIKIKPLVQKSLLALMKEIW